MDLKKIRIFLCVVEIVISYTSEIDTETIEIIEINKMLIKHPFEFKQSKSQ